MSRKNKVLNVDSKITSPNSSRSNSKSKRRLQERNVRKNKTIEIEFGNSNSKDKNRRRVNLSFFDKRNYSPNKIKIPIKGQFVKGVVNTQFQDDVKQFRQKFSKSHLKINDRLQYFYGPYETEQNLLRLQSNILPMKQPDLKSSNVIPKKKGAAT
jgi:hypothetical protein